MIFFVRNPTFETLILCQRSEFSFNNAIFSIISGISDVRIQVLIDLDFFSKIKDECLILDSLRHVFDKSNINLTTVGDPTGIYFNINDENAPIIFLMNNQKNPRTYVIRSPFPHLNNELTLNSNCWWFTGIDIKNKQLITFKNQTEMNRKIIKIINNKIDFNQIYNNTISKYDFKKIIRRFYKKNKF